MKGQRLSLLALVALLLLSCLPAPESTLPTLEDSYNPIFRVTVRQVEGRWFFFQDGQKGNPVLDLKPFTTVLQLKPGIVLMKAVRGRAGEDEYGNVVGTYGDGYAAVTKQNAGYFFDGTKNPEEALKYAALLQNSLGLSLYGNAYAEITSGWQFWTTVLLPPWRLVRRPPVSSSTVVTGPNYYVVKRLYKLTIGQQKVMYAESRVFFNGKFEEAGVFQVAKGPQGPVP